ncbi:hypothetical protein AAZX31_19G183600 [Glycine max]
MQNLWLPWGSMTLSMWLFNILFDWTIKLEHTL